MLLVIALLCISVSAQTGAKCGFVDPVTNATFDLSPLIGSTYTVKTMLYTYDISICANIQQPCAGKTASICQGDPVRKPEAYVVQVWDSTPQWSLVMPGNVSAGVRVITTNGGACYPTNNLRWSSIQFVCTNSTESMAVVSEAPPAPCSQAPGYTFRLLTPHACVAPPPPCVWLESTPCVVKQFSVSSGGGPDYGAEIRFNSDTNSCGAVYFIGSGQIPNDLCGNVIISYYPYAQLSQIVQLLQQSTSTLFYYDPASHQSILDFDSQKFAYKR